MKARTRGGGGYGVTPFFVTDAELKARRHQQDAAQGPTALFVEGRMTDFGGGRNPVGVSEMGDIPVHHTRPPHAHSLKFAVLWHFSSSLKH